MGRRVEGKRKGNWEGWEGKKGDERNAYTSYFLAFPCFTGLFA